MDMLMPEFEASNPDFFQEYFDARMCFIPLAGIVNSGTSKQEDEAAAA